MKQIIQLLLSALAVIISAYILPGVKVDSFFTALVVAVMLAIANAIIKPILIILTLPINILTLGLLTFVLNGFIILLVSALVPGFKVQGLLWAIIFSIVLSLVSSIISTIR